MIPEKPRTVTDDRPKGSRMSRRPSPTTIIACFALFFSLAGTGIAASRYITSTGQIKPSVRLALVAKVKQEAFDETKEVVAQLNKTTLEIHKEIEEDQEIICKNPYTKVPVKWPDGAKCR
jgi:hypothetical protein